MTLMRRPSAPNLPATTRVMCDTAALPDEYAKVSSADVVMLSMELMLMMELRGLLAGSHALSSSGSMACMCACGVRGGSRKFRHNIHKIQKMAVMPVEFLNPLRSGGKTEQYHR